MDIPAAIQTVIDATNAGDSDGFVAAFTDDGVIDDWGRVFHGRTGVASWNSTDNIGVHAHFEFVSIAPGDAPDSFVVVLAVSGDGYNGTGPMTFTVRDGLVSALTISPS